MIDATLLDTWVFDKVRELFTTAAKNVSLDSALRQDQNIFFLHLLGLDTTGHAHRPYSKEYYHNIKVVDQGVKDMTRLIEDYYADGKTAFVFTADHGMSDWGSHGDGHPDNTRTPLISWGSGVAKPVVVQSGKAKGHEDGFSADWGLDGIQRNDVSQADIAALMAYLAGIEYPVNSVGELPLAYIAAESKEKANAALVNAQGVLEMYRVKEREKRNKELRYRAYAPLGDKEHSVEHRVNEILNEIEAGQFDRAIAMSQDLLHIGLDGLRYLQTYDWLFLRAVVTTGYLGWIAFAVTTVIDMHVLHGKTATSRTTTSSGLFGALGVAFLGLLIARKAPITYYAYTIFPIGFWEDVVARRQALVFGSRILFNDIRTKGRFAIFSVQTLGFLGLLEALVRLYSPQEKPRCLILTSTSGTVLLSSDCIFDLFHYSSLLAYYLRSPVYT